MAKKPKGGHKGKQGASDLLNSPAWCCVSAGHACTKATPKSCPGSFIFDTNSANSHALCDTNCKAGKGAMGNLP
jgi:hypothetical protein